MGQSHPVLDGFTIEKRLGTGGMGQVYLAQQHKLKRQVALKLLHSDSPTAALQEARNQAQLNHDNVAKVHDVLEANPTKQQPAAIVMEYVAGKSLNRHQNENLLSQQHKLALLSQVAAGLKAIHQAGLLHCDIKPDNVIVTPDGQAKIVDFGIAASDSKDAQTDKQSNNEASTFGSQLWLAPECLQGGNASQQSDIYSFGLLAWYLLGDPAWFDQKDASDNESLRQKLLAQPAQQSALPPGLLQLLKSLIADSPKQRANSMAEVLATLAYWQQEMAKTEAANMATQPIDVLANKLQKQRRNKLLGVVAVAFALLAVTVAVFWTTPWQQPQVEYVAVMPVQIQSNNMPEAQTMLVRSVLVDTLQSTLLDQPNLQLIPPDEVDALYNQPGQDANASIPVSQVAAATGATAVLSAQLDCNPQHCNINLLRYAPDRKDPARWLVQAQQHFPSQIESPNALSLALQQQLQNLFTQLAPSELGQRQLTDELYKEYLQIFADINYQGNRSKDNLVKLDKLLDAEPNFKPVYWLYRELAIFLFSEHGEESYLTKLEERLAMAPEKYKSDFSFIQHFFWTQLQKADFASAKEVLNKVSKEHSYQKVIDELNGHLNFYSGEYGKAIEFYSKSLVGRFSTSNLYNLAVSNWYIGNLDEALLALKKIITVTPKDTSTIKLLASVQLFRGDLDDSILNFKSIPNHDSSSSALTNLSLALLLKRDYLSALVYAEKAYEISPKNTAIILNLADILLVTKSESKANDLYKKILELTEDASDLYTLLERAQALAHLNRNIDAINAITSASKISHDNGEVHFITSIVHAVADENLNAIIYAKKALEKGFGVTWFNLPWFDNLCIHHEFEAAMAQYGENNRCPAS